MKPKLMLNGKDKRLRRLPELLRKQLRQLKESALKLKKLLEYKEKLRRKQQESVQRPKKQSV